MMIRRKWQVLADRHEEKSLIDLLLSNRGLKDPTRVDEFLNPREPWKIDPVELGIDKGELLKAVEVLSRAIKTGKGIVVYGDYDADGLCAAAILWQVIDALGGRAMPFVPTRKDHGYGLSQKGISEILQNGKYKGFSLIVTVDNGIVAYKGLEFARDKGFEVIVTDHHVRGEKQIDALAVVHTVEVCGAGVAWFLASELVKYFDKWELLGFKLSGYWLGLAAVATVTDLVELRAVSRSILKWGLDYLRRDCALGLAASLKEAGIKQTELESWHLGFVVGPRLNAMGRMDKAIDGLRLLCTRDKKRAEDLAKVLGQTNRRRQELTVELFNRAREKLGKTPGKLIFLADKSFDEGVIGLVAGRLVDEFYRPAIVVSVGRDISKASARSVKGFNIIEFIKQVQGSLLEVGGHPMAAGFSIETSRIDEVRQRLQSLSEDKLSDQVLTPRLIIDCELSLEEVSKKTYFEIERLKPFGMGNRKPVFVTRNLRIVSMRRVGGDGKHLKFRFDDPKTQVVEKQAAEWVMGSDDILGSSSKFGEIDAIGFGLGHKSQVLRVGQRVDVVYTLDLNTWNGKQEVQMKVKDIKKH